MLRTFKRRLLKLEQSSGDPICPICGRPPATADGPVPISFVLLEESGPPPVGASVQRFRGAPVTWEEGEPQACKRCGLPLDIAWGTMYEQDLSYQGDP